VKFLDKCEWQNGFKVDIKRGLALYTEGSEVNKGAGDGVHRWGSRRDIDSSVGSTPQYSRLKYTPFRLVE